MKFFKSHYSSRTEVFFSGPSILRVDPAYLQPQGQKVVQAGDAVDGAGKKPADPTFALILAVSGLPVFRSRAKVTNF